MKTYYVTMTETTYYRVEVQAESEDAAEVAAEEAFVQGHYEFMFAGGREVDEVQEVAK